jgi:hypothetical protein
MRSDNSEELEVESWKLEVGRKCTGTTIDFQPKEDVDRRSDRYAKAPLYYVAQLDFSLRIRNQLP